MTDFASIADDIADTIKEGNTCILLSIDEAEKVIEALHLAAETHNALVEPADIGMRKRLDVWFNTLPCANLGEREWNSLLAIVAPAQDAPKPIGWLSRDGVKALRNDCDVTICCDNSAYGFDIPVYISPEAAAHTEGAQDAPQPIDMNSLAHSDDKVLRDLAIIVMSEQTGSRSLMSAAEAAVKEIVSLRARGSQHPEGDRS